MKILIRFQGLVSFNIQSMAKDFEAIINIMVLSNEACDIGND